LFAIIVGRKCGPGYIIRKSYRPSNNAAPSGAVEILPDNKADNQSTGCEWQANVAPGQLRFFLGDDDPTHEHAPQSGANYLHGGQPISPWGEAKSKSKS